MKLGSRFILPGLIFCVSIVLTVQYLYLQSFEAAETSNERVKYTYEVMETSGQLLTLLLNAETGVRGYLLTKEKSFLEPYAEARSSADEIIGRLNGQVSDNPAQQLRVDTLKNLYGQRLQNMAQRMAQIDGKEETQIDLSLEGKEIMDEIQAVMDRFIATEQALLTRRNTDSAQARRNTFTTMIYGTGVSMLMLGFLFYSLFRENRQRKTNEHELFVKNEFIHQTIASMGDGFIATDTNGVITLINRVACDLTGWKREEAIGKHIDMVFEITHEQSGLKVINPVMEALQKNKVVLLANHTTLRRKDGSRIFIDDSGAPIHNETGEVIGAVLVFRDITDKKKKEDDLLAANKRFTSIFNLSPVAIAISDATDGKIMYVNDACCQLIGARREQLIGKTSVDLNITPNAPRQAAMEQLKRSGGQMRMVEASIRKVNGEMCDVLISIDQLEIDGRLCLATSLTDITTRKKAEKEIKLLNEKLEERVAERTQEVIEKEKRYKETLDNMLEGVQIIGFDWKHLYVNNVAAGHARYGKEEMIGHTLMEKFPGIEKTNVYAAYQRCFTERMPINFETEFTFPDGSTGWFRVSIQPVKEGILILSDDITEEKKSKSENERKNHFLNQVLSTQQVVFYIVRVPEFAITYISDNAVIITGYAAEDFIRNHDLWVQGLLAEDAARVLSELETKVAEGKGSIKYRWQCANGTVKWFNDQFVVVTEKTGEQFLYGAWIDIHSQVQSEQQLEIQNRELLKTNSELDRFVYSASHDLRSPLTSLLGLIRIAEHYTTEAEQKKRFGMMKRTVNKLDTFIGEILDYSRNSRTGLARDEVRFEELINESREHLQHMEATVPYQLQVNVAQNGKFVSDKRRIAVVLNNIIANAIKYLDGSREQPLVQITVHTDKHNARIQIEDNGIGISESDKEKIFDMFFRATQISSGSGLGLYIVKETLDKLKGTVAVESELQQGSKFVVTIPNQINSQETGG